MKLLYHLFILSQFIINVCYSMDVFAVKQVIKNNANMKRSLRIVYNEPHMPLEELLIHDQGMGVHHKHQYFIN